MRGTEHDQLPLRPEKGQKNHSRREFLLAERGLLSRFSELLHGEEDGALSGNVFTLTKQGDACILLNDMTEHTLEMPTADLRELTDSYRKEVKRLRTESRK